MRPASAAERRRLHDTFSALCAIPSPSGDERAVADWVLAALSSMGVAASEDDAGRELGGNAGNLLARLPAPAGRHGTPTILLCAHLDTVGVNGPIEPVIEDDAWTNRHDAILGADNKAALAVILEVVRRVTVESAPVGLELLFTVGEENALAGAQCFDQSQLQCDWGYVFDHATAIGEVIVAAPSYYRLSASFVGRAAHAGICPQDGRSAILAAARAIAAMPNGRLDHETTVNVGHIEGGTAGATNVVPAACTVLAECRSLDDDRARAVVTDIVQACQLAANDPSAPCDVDVDVERLFTAYRHAPEERAVLAAEDALRECGFTPLRIATGGGSDAAVFEAAGLRCTNIANGTEAPHRPDERVATASLDAMLDVTLALLGACAAVGHT